MRDALVLGLFATFAAAAALPACTGDDAVLVSGPASETLPDGGTSGTPSTGSCAKTCGGACAAPDAPATGCAGSSCEPCSAPEHLEAVCVAGACAASASCANGYADCGPAPGCETHTAEDPTNCGACGNACGAANTTSAPLCVDGGCQFACASPYAHCGASAATGCETNLGTSSASCGGCGHSCFGGTCVAGHCSPVLLAGGDAASGLFSLYGMAVANGYLYGTNWYAKGGVVYRVPTTGGALQWIAGPGEATGANIITTDGANRLAYFVYSNTQNTPHGPGLWTMNADGTTDTRTFPAGQVVQRQCPSAPVPDFMQALAFDDQFLYWTHLRDAGDPAGPCPGIVRSKPDGSDQKRFLAAKRIGNLLADGGSLYFTNLTDGSVEAAVATTLDAPTELAKVGTPSYVQTDATYLYWIDASAQKLYRVKKVGGSSYVDITPGGPGGVLPAKPNDAFLVDDTDVYFVAPRSGYGSPVEQKIYRMKKDGSQPAVAIATLTTDNVVSFGQDRTALYWTTYGPANVYAGIYKLAK